MLLVAGPLRKKRQSKIVSKWKEFRPLEIQFSLNRKGAHSPNDPSLYF